MRSTPRLEPLAGLGLRVELGQQAFAARNPEGFFQVPGMQGRIETAKAQGGLVRITVPGTCAPYIFPQLPLIAGTKPSVCIGLLMAGLELGSDPDTWRFTPTPVPTALFREIELFDFANNRWLAIDLAELACRN